MSHSDSTRRWRRLGRHASTWVGGAIVIGCLIIAALADVLSPYNPSRLGAEPFLPASWQHWFGTDLVGRDVLSRVIYGTRLSLMAGTLSMLLAVGIGAPLGAVAGYLGGWVDQLAMRAIDVLLSLPSILIALLLVVATSPGWTAVVLSIGLINMPTICRQMRATVLTVKHHDYVLASRSLGATSAAVLMRSIVPALLSPLLALTTLGLGTAILEVAGLSFLGIAGEPDAAEWGAMLRVAKDTLSRAPACTWLAPGGAITLAVLGFSLLGDGLRDFVEPG